MNNPLLDIDKEDKSLGLDEIIIIIVCVAVVLFAFVIAVPIIIITRKMKKIDKKSAPEIEAQKKKKT